MSKSTFLGIVVPIFLIGVLCGVCLFGACLNEERKRETLKNNSSRVVKNLSYDSVNDTD